MTQWEFSPRDPKATMKVVSKVERIQPVMVGVDQNGEPIWEGQAMARWQMELLRLQYYGDFMASWIKRKFNDYTGFDMDGDSLSFTHWTHSQFDVKHRADRKHRRNRGD